MLTGQLALIAAAIFTGAAVYVSLCEQPARLALDERALLTEWKRFNSMQASVRLRYRHAEIRKRLGFEQ